MDCTKKDIQINDTINKNKLLIYNCTQCIYVMVTSNEYCKICCNKCIFEYLFNCPDCTYIKVDNGFQKKLICSKCL